MFILTDKYGLKYGNVLAMDEDLDSIFFQDSVLRIPDTNEDASWVGKSDTILHIGGDEEKG